MVSPLHFWSLKGMLTWEKLDQQETPIAKGLTIDGLRQTIIYIVTELSQVLDYKSESLPLHHTHLRTW